MLDKQALTGALMVGGAGPLSAYDAFTGALPALRRDGKYRFVTSHAPTATLLTAPFDPEFLTQWTTWIHLAYTGAIVVILLNEREPGVAYEPFKARDAAFATGLSLSAGAGEEALFRGWLFSLLHQNTGERFWFSNGIQAVIFGGLHLPQAKAFAAAIAGGRSTRAGVLRGLAHATPGWSVRESIFHTSGTTSWW
jgi:membrane protease YdiL (CAAX protease family)